MAPDVRHRGGLTTAVNVEEIIRGLRPSEHAAADALFTAVRVLPVREPDARRAGQWRRTMPKDFPMPEITVEEWPPGS